MSTWHEKCRKMETAVEAKMNPGIWQRCPESCFTIMPLGLKNDLNRKFECMEFGDDPQCEIDPELHYWVDEAAPTAFSNERVSNMKSIPEAHKSVFHIVLGGGGPSKIPPMKIVFSKRLASMKLKRYKAEQLLFFDNDIDRLVELGFIAADTTVLWSAVPHLEPNPHKPSSVQYYQRFSNSKRGLPGGDLSNGALRSRTLGHYIHNNFSWAYWQMPLHTSSYSACGIICSGGTFVSTNVLHGLKQAAAHFQSTIPQCFHSRQDELKYWIHKLTLCATTEIKLLEYLKNFLTSSPNIIWYYPARNVLPTKPACSGVVHLSKQLVVTWTHAVVKQFGQWAPCKQLTSFVSSYQYIAAYEKRHAYHISKK